MEISNKAAGGQEESKNEGGQMIDEVKVMKNKYTRNVQSPFISEQREWQDGDHFSLSPELIKGITEENEFRKPSKIQAVAIPLIIQEPVNNLIAQAKNGTGKTGAFVIGSLLRVDPADKKPQVITLAHTRELVQQILNVYKNIAKHTDINIQAMEER